MADHVLVQPILPVSDLDAAEAWYAAAGFDVRRYDDGYAWVWRDGRELWHLQVRDDMSAGASPAALYVHTADVDGWHAAFAVAGHPVSPVEVQPWGMREFRVVDPDGSTIRVGAPA